MKTNYFKRTLKNQGACLAASVALVSAFNLCWAGGTISIGNFDTSDLTGWKGLNTSAIQWSSQNSGSSAGSGSLQVHMTVTSPTSWEPAQAQFDLNSLVFNSSNYWSVGFDIKVDPSSCPGTDTAFGYVAVVPLGNTWQWLDKLCWIPTTASFTGWQHIEAIFQQPYANLDALVFQINNSSFNQDVIFYIDNIKVNPVPFSCVVDQFTNSTEADSWVYQNWSQPGAASWVSTPDAGGATPTGALRLDCNFTNPPSPMEEQAVFQKDFHVDPNRFANLEMDVMTDPSSYPMGNGALPQIEAILNENGNYGWVFLGLQNLPAPGSWTHLKFPLAGPLAANPLITNLNSIILRVDGGGNGNPGPTNSVRVFVDNIKLAQNSPPSLSLVTNDLAPGLRLGCTAVKDWQRQGIVTPATTRNYTWVGQTQPVTYSFTITNFPDWSTNGDFEAHLWLINYDTLNNQNDETWSEVDYNGTDVIYLKLKNSYGSGVVFSFNVKTESSYSTSYAQVDSLFDVSALGKWSVTFNTDGTVTLTSPSGLTETFMLDSTIAARFSGQMSLNFGVTKNGDAANNGLFATFSRIDVTGVPNPIAETFAGSTLASSWRTALSDSTGLWFVPTGTSRWLTWNLPDGGFNLQTTTGLPGGWTTLTPASMYQGSTEKAVPLSSTTMSSGSAFFRLAQ